MELHELVARARERLQIGPAMRLAVLFGSHARGAERPGSDVDIAFIPRDPALSLWDEGRIASKLEAALHHPVDLVRLDLAPTLVRWEVIKSGIPLLAEPADEWTSLITQVLAEHADYAPAAEAAARSVLHRLADSGAS